MDEKMDQKLDVADRKQFIVIRLGNEQYGIDIRFVENIVRMQKITRVPKMPPFFIGIINLRGEVLPVMSLRVKLGLEKEEYEKKTRIIILKTQREGNLGVIVDEVKEVVTMESAQVDRIDGLKLDGKNHFISGVGKRENGDLISLLDLSKITLDENA